MAKSIKLYDGVRVEYKGKTHIYESPVELWEAFGWDIKNDENAHKASLEITRNLVGFGYCQFNDDNGREVYIEFIPAKEEE